MVIDGTFRNLALSDPDEYFVTIALFDIGGAGRIAETATAAIVVPERYEVTNMVKTFATSVLTSSGPYVPAWAYHVASEASPVTDPPALSILGFSVKQP